MQLFVGTRKGLFVLERRERWTITAVHFAGVPVTMVLSDPRDGSLVAALEHGHFGPKIHVSADGQTWEERATPAYPPTAEGDGPSVATIWALEAADPARPGTLWCGTIPGGLFRSDDAGASWSLVDSLWDDPLRQNWMGGGADQPGLHSVLVHPDDPRRVTIAVSCGGIWETRDAGASWTIGGEGLIARFMPPDRQRDPSIQDPHQIARCGAHPDVIWCQHHNGVFRSTDGGALWHELEVPPSSFGFAVAAHPTDPDTAWFVPAQADRERIPVDGRVVVARTTDGGRSFEVLTEGLPQEHAYDLVFRHALDVDGSGRVLAFGSTTGNLWVTEDGGDHWESLSHHLPPIYCVRFGRSPAQR